MHVPFSLTTLHAYVFAALLPLLLSDSPAQAAARQAAPLPPLLGLEKIHMSRRKMQKCWRKKIQSCGIRREKCQNCGKKCSHGNLPKKCKLCQSVLRRMKRLCKECDGSGLCEHGKDKDQCRVTADCARGPLAGFPLPESLLKQTTHPQTRPCVSSRGQCS